MADILCISDGTLNGSVRVKSGSGFQDEETRFTLEYQIRTRNMLENWSTIRFDPKLPQIGDQVNGCRCKSLDFKEVKTLFENGQPYLLYIISYHFDSEMPGSSGWPSGETSPDEWPFEWECDSTSFTAPLTHDANTGDLVATPNGEVIPIETDFGALTMTVTGYESYTFDPTVYVQRLYRVNEKTFLNCGPEHVLIKQITARPVCIRGILWFRVTYTLEIRDNSDMPYRAQVLNHGTLVREEIDGEIKTTADVLGRNCTVNLDLNGVIYKGDEPLVLNFSKYRTIDFDDFLPTERFEAALLKNVRKEDNIQPLIG